MKENYIYTKGDVLINNYGKTRLRKEKREYQDNIEEILEIENIIEELEIEKENYTESIKIKKSNIKYNNKNNILITLVSVIIGTIIMFCDPYVNPLAIGQGIRLWVGAFTAGEIFVLLSPLLLNNFKNNKELKKEINGLNLCYKKIEEQIKSNENLLIKLKSNKSKENEKQAKQMVKAKEINHLEKLKELKKLLALYCAIGTNENEFKEYYEKGILDSKLEQDFRASDIETIKIYFKSKKAK